MSELLQSEKHSLGQHPDADQLSAFVEHALPEHERLETLAHLAHCADCREVVALSLLPLEDIATVEPIPKPVAPTRSSVWSAELFSRRNLVWIAAPALAALVILTIHLRNLPVSPRPVATPGQLADSHPPAQPAPPPLGAKPDASIKRKAVHGGQTVDAAKPRLAPEANSAAAPAINGRDQAALKLPTAPLGVQGAAVQNSAVQDRVAPAASSQPSAQARGGPAPVHGSMAGMVPGGAAAKSSPRPGGMALGFLQQAPRPAPAAPRAPQLVAPPLGSVVSRSAPARQVPPPVMNQSSVSVSVSASGAAPAAASRVAADSAPIAVNAQSAQVEEVEVAIAGREVSEAPAGHAAAKSAYVPGQAPLPSGLAVLSFAANFHQRLALDARSQLFFSEDDGRHWKTVSVPWRARAMTVATVSAAPHRATEFVLAVPEHYTPGAPALSEPRYDQGSSTSSLSGSVTDASGAVISGATVVATDSRTVLTRAAQTNAAGRYLLQELPPGDYWLEVRAPGFLKQSQTMALAPSQQAVKNIVLAVGQSNEAVTVQASPAGQLKSFSRAMSLGAMKAKKPAAPSASPAPNKLPPVFVITTDTGDRWTSVDGQTWKPE